MTGRLREPQPVPEQSAALATLQHGLATGRLIVGQGPVGTEVPDEYSHGPYPPIGRHNITQTQRGEEVLGQIHDTYNLAGAAEVLESYTWGLLHGVLDDEELPRDLGNQLKSRARAAALGAATRAYQRTGVLPFVLDTARTAVDCHRHDYPAKLSDSELDRAHASQAGAFAAAGSRGVLLQTFQSLREMEVAKRAFDAAGVPILGVSAYCRRTPDGLLLPSGDKLTSVATFAEDNGLWVGANCVTPVDGVAAIREFISLTKGGVPLYVALNGLNTDPASETRTDAELREEVVHGRPDLEQAYTEIVQTVCEMGKAGIILASCCFTGPGITRTIANIVRAAQADAGQCDNIISEQGANNETG